MKFKYKENVGMTWRDLKPGVHYSVQPFSFNYQKLHGDGDFSIYQYDRVQLQLYDDKPAYLIMKRKGGQGSADIQRSTPAGIAYLDSLVFIIKGEIK